MASEFRFWFWCICQSSAESGQSLVFSADQFSLGQHLQCIWESSHKKLWEWPWLVSLAPEGCGVASPHAQPGVSWWRYLKAHLGSKKAVLARPCAQLVEPLGPFLRPPSPNLLQQMHVLRTQTIGTIPSVYGGAEDTENPLVTQPALQHQVVLPFQCPNPGSDTKVSLSMNSRRLMAVSYPHSCMSGAGASCRAHITRLTCSFSIVPFSF